MEFFVTVGLQWSWCIGKTRRTPEKAIFVAEVTGFEAEFVIDKESSATVALVAENEPVSGARGAFGGIRCGQVLEKLLQLADLVEVSQVFDSTNVLAGDENTWQVQLGPSEAHEVV